MIRHSEYSEDLIESRVEAHDSHHFEVKLDYSIDPTRARNRYKVEAYFFVPNSLGINRETYNTRLFFRDVMGYIRFKTPRLALDTILEPGYVRSPLYRIHRVLEKIRAGNTAQKLMNNLEHELRLLGCLVRANIRDHVREAVQVLPASLEEAGAGKMVELEEGMVELLHQVEAVLGEYRRLGPLLAGHEVSPIVEETCQWVDEYLSIVVESHLTILLETLDDERFRDTFKKVRGLARETLVRERAHRDRAGYPRILADGIPNEHYVYRKGLLKKLTMSVLFLRVKRKKEDNRLTDFVASIAAGVAMLFAAYATIASQELYGLNTGPFVAALVVSYILKDRIKDWIRRYSFSLLRERLWDRSIQIEDRSNGMVVGRCREAFDFISRSSIPERVFGFRHGWAPESIEARSKHETCMLYAKEISLNGARIGDKHIRLLDINDIMRFSVSHFLLRADDPKQTVRLYSVSRESVDLVECPKVYQINLILKFFSGPGYQDVSMERVRVIMDGEGIRAIDHIPEQGG